MTFLIVYRLQSDILHEPDQAVHNSSHFSKLFGASPRAFAEASLHIFSTNQILVDMEEKFTSFDKLLDQVAILFVLRVGDRAFL